MLAETFNKTTCNHCGGHIEFPVDAAGMRVSCPHCQAEVVLSVTGKSGKGWRFVLVGLLVAGLAAGGFFMFTHSQSTKVSKHSPIPNPAPPDLQRINEFAFWDFSLERKEDSVITHAVARVVNETDRTRYGVEVELELYDELDRAVGTAKDYLEMLEPGQEGRVRALVIKRNAVRARALQVTEH